MPTLKFDIFPHDIFSYINTTKLTENRYPQCLRSTKHGLGLTNDLKNILFTFVICAKASDASAQLVLVKRSQSGRRDALRRETLVPGFDVFDFCIEFILKLKPCFCVRPANPAVLITSEVLGWADEKRIGGLRSEDTGS